MVNVKDIQNIIVEYRKTLLARGWAYAQCGGLSIKWHDVYHLPSNTVNLVYAEFNNVEKIASTDDVPNDICAGFWGEGFRKFGRDAAIIHTSSVNGIRISNQLPSEFRFKPGNAHWFMAMNNYLNHEGCYTLPIIASVDELDPLLVDQSVAVLIRNQGLLTWSSSINQTINQCEALERSFEMAIKGYLTI